jgi:titin
VNDVAERNVISGNTGGGVEITGISASGNFVTGNHIGTNAAGTADLGNQNGVLVVNSSANTIGGNSAGLRNVVSGSSSGNGVVLAGSSATANVVQGNFIGTDATGTVAIGNHYGLFVSGNNNIIGGSEPGAGNVISGQSSSGVSIDEIAGGGSGNIVRGNLIGTDVSGTLPLPNRVGVWIDGAAANTIGGTSVGAGNIISGNEDWGIMIQYDTAAGNMIQGISWAPMSPVPSIWGTRKRVSGLTMLRTTSSAAWLRERAM